MNLTTELLFTLTTSHFLVIIAITVYSLVKLSAVKNGSLTIHEFCATANDLIPIKLALHGFCAYLLYVHDHSRLAVLNLPMIAWTLSEIIWSWKTGIYDPVEMARPGQVNRHRLYHIVGLFHFAVSAYLHIRRLNQGVKLLKSWDLFIPTEALLYLLILVLTYAIIILLAYYLQRIADLELLEILSEDDEGLTGRMICRKLNKMLGIKLLLHGLISSFLLVSGYYELVLIHFPILVWEVFEITNREEGSMGSYDTRNPTVVEDRRKLCNRQIVFLFAFLYLMTYLMVGETRDPLELSALSRYQIVTLVHAILMIIPLTCVLIIAICKKWPHKVNDVKCCVWLNTLLYLQTIFHMHSTMFMIAQGHWVIFLVNALFFIAEAFAVTDEEDYFTGFFSFEDIREREYYLIHFLLCGCHAAFYFIMCNVGLYYIYLIRTKRNYVQQETQADMQFVRAVWEGLTHTVTDFSSWVNDTV